MSYSYSDAPTAEKDEILERLVAMVNVTNKVLLDRAVRYASYQGDAKNARLSMAALRECALIVIKEIEICLPRR